VVDEEHGAQLTRTECATPHFGWHFGGGAFHLAMSTQWLLSPLINLSSSIFPMCNPFFFRSTFTRWPNCLPNLIATSVICAGQLTSVTIGRQGMELEGRTFALWSCTLSFTGLQLSNQCIWLMVTKLQSSEPTFPFFEATYLGGGVSKHLRANHKVISALFGQHH